MSFYKKICIVTDFFPVHGTDGRSAYLLDMIAYFDSIGIKTRLVNLSDTPNGTLPWYRLDGKLIDVAEVESIGYVRVGPILLSSSFRRWLLAVPCILFRLLPEHFQAWLRKRVFGRDGGTSHFHTLPGSVRYLQRALTRFMPELLLYGCARLAFMFEEIELPAGMAIGAVSHDVRHKRYQSIVEQGWNAYNGEVIDRESEARQLAAADTIIAIQPDEAEVFRTMVPDKRVICAPMSVSAESRPANSPSGNVCLMVGGFGATNVRSFQWFIDTVWPCVAGRIDNAELRICGNVCRGLRVGDNHRIVLVGWVNELEQEYIDAAVVVIPLLAGSGLKIKLIEALGYGCRCVSTSVGVQGLGKPEKWGIAVADSPTSMTDAIVAAISEPEENNIRARRKEQIAQLYSPENCYRPIITKANYENRR